MSLIKNIYTHKDILTYTTTVVVDFVDGTQSMVAINNHALQDHDQYLIKDAIQKILYNKIEDDAAELLKKTPTLPKVETSQYGISKVVGSVAPPNENQSEFQAEIQMYKVFQDLYPETKHWLNKHMEDLKTKPKPEEHFKEKYFSPLTKPKLTPQLSSATVLGALGAVCPDLLQISVKCPRCESPHSNSIAEIIMHLNDSTPWTREQIADWLETLDADLNLLKEEK